MINAAQYTVVYMIDLYLNKLASTLPELQGLYALRPDVKDIIGSKVGTIAQVAVCYPTHALQQGNKDNKICHCSEFIIIVNTHLFFHPAAEYVRLIQVYIIMKEVQRIKTRLMNGVISPEDKKIDGREVFWRQPKDRDVVCSHTPCVVRCIYTGDFNSTPETPTIEFIIKYVYISLL